MLEIDNTPQTPATAPKATEWVAPCAECAKKYHAGGVEWQDLCSKCASALVKQEK